MPTVQVSLFATLRQHIGGAASREVQCAAGATLSQILAQLGIAAEETKIVFVNNRHAGLEQVVAEGDQIAVFPAIGGG